MFGPSPHSVWDGEDLMQMILPLWGEADEEKRIAGWKDVDKHIAENALVHSADPVCAADPAQSIRSRSHRMRRVRCCRI